MELVGLGMRGYYSIRHLQSATFFVRRATKVEARAIRCPMNEELQPMLQSYVAAVFFSSTAFLDALCSELISDAALPDGGHLSALEPDVLLRVAKVRKLAKDGRPEMMSKFDEILEACDLAPIRSSAAAEVLLAIKFRNRLVHYKPEWLDVGTADHVRPGNFMESDFRDEMQERFPRLATAGLLGADVLLRSDCAAWALRASVAYADEVFHRLSIGPIYSHVRPDVR